MVLGFVGGGSPAMPRLATAGSGGDNESGMPCNCDEEEGVLDCPGVSERKSDGKAATRVNTTPATVTTAVMMVAHVAGITFKMLNIQAAVISNATMTMVAMTTFLRENHVRFFS